MNNSILCFSLLLLAPASFAQGTGNCEAISFNLFGRVAVVKRSVDAPGICGTIAVKTFKNNPSDEAKVHFSYETARVVVRGNLMRKSPSGRSAECEIRYLHPVAGELHAVHAQVTFQKCVASAMSSLAINLGRMHEAHLRYSSGNEAYEGAFSAQTPFKKGPVDPRDFNNIMY